MSPWVCHFNHDVSSSLRSEGDSIINNMYLVEGLYSECLFEFKSILSKYIQCNFE